MTELLEEPLDVGACDMSYEAVAAAVGGGEAGFHVGRQALGPPYLQALSSPALISNFSPLRPPRQLAGRPCPLSSPILPAGLTPPPLTWQALQRVETEARILAHDGTPHLGQWGT